MKEAFRKFNKAIEEFTNESYGNSMLVIFAIMVILIMPAVLLDHYVWHPNGHQDYYNSLPHIDVNGQDCRIDDDPNMIMGGGEQHHYYAICPKEN